MVTEAHNAFPNHSKQMESPARALQTKGDKRNKLTYYIAEAVREELKRQKKAKMKTGNG